MVYEPSWLRLKRKAWKECLDLVVEAQVSKAVFHWYRGTPQVLSDVLDHGYLISATPAAESSEKHQAALRQAPLRRILLESEKELTKTHAVPQGNRT